MQGTKSLQSGLWLRADSQREGKGETPSQHSSVFQKKQPWVGRGLLVEEKLTHVLPLPFLPVDLLHLSLSAALTPTCQPGVASELGRAREPPGSLGVSLSDEGSWGGREADAQGPVCCSLAPVLCPELGCSVLGMEEAVATHDANHRPQGDSVWPR